MARKATVLAFALAPLLLAAAPARAADDSEVQQLREKLRSTVLQLRELQDRQAAQTAQPPAPAPVPATTAAAPDAAQKAKLAAARGEAAAARRHAADLQAQLAKAQADATASAADAQAKSAELQKARDSYEQTAANLRAAAEERNRFQAQLEATQTVVRACQAKNEKLTAFAETLLDDARRFGVVSALRKDEPVLGLRRVQLENLAQDREDTVRANRCDAGPVAPEADSPRLP